MQSSQNDNKLSHKLVQRQRKNNRNATTDIVIVNGIEESSPAHILDGWQIILKSSIVMSPKYSKTLKLKN